MAISNNLRSNLNKLNYIAKINNKKLQKSLLCDFYKQNKLGFYKCFQEIALNLYNCNIKLNKKQKQNLKKHYNLIKSLTKKQRNKKHEKKLVVQSGGFLQIILPALLSTVAGIVGDKLLK